MFTTSKLVQAMTTISMAFFLVAFQPAFAQDANSREVTVYQYRHVPDNKIDEFIKRETTYWSKVAQKAVKKKTMTFWALLEKVGGYDLPNHSNFLFVNTFPNIDSIGDVFNAPEKTAGVPMAQMETNSISTVTSEFFLHSVGWAQVDNADPAKDFNYINFIYHNTNYADSLIALENKYWSPFIKDAMNKKWTPQKAWGNAVVLSPSGDDIKFTTVSYDLYKNLADALMPNLSADAQIPMEGLSKIGAIETGRRGSVIYRIVKVVAAN